MEKQHLVKTDLRKRIHPRQQGERLVQEKGKVVECSMQATKEWEEEMTVEMASVVKTMGKKGKRQRNRKMTMTKSVLLLTPYLVTRLMTVTKTRILQSL